MSNFVGLNTALSGVRAAQLGLETAGNNIANVNTPGHTRQRVDLRAANPYQSAIGPAGTGVDIDGISRLRDAFLDTRVRTTTAQSAMHDARATMLGRAEEVLAEPENGLSKLVGELWNAFEDLSLDPADSAGRQQALSALGALTSRIDSVNTGWTQLGQDAGVRLEDGVNQVNRLLGRVAEINSVLASSGQAANNLLDERDLALDELAELVGADSTLNDGVMTVAIDGQTVLEAGVVHGALQQHPDGGLHVVDTDGATLTTQVQGELGAVARFRTEELPALQDGLADWTVQLQAELNAIHEGGTDLHGDAGLPLLETVDGRLRVNPAIVADPNRIAASESGAKNDGKVAEQLAALRTDAVAGGDASLGRLFDRFVVDLGGKVQDAKGSAEAQSALTRAAISGRQSAHGVSIDEELAFLVQYQRALEASSRVMTAVDEALQTLVNRTGLVGR